MAVKRFARRLGYDIVKRHSLDDLNPFEQQRRLLTGVDLPVILDVGAHIGETSTAYAKLFPNARIHAFEPFPASFAALSQNTFKLSQVTAHPIGLAESPQAFEFNVNASAATNSLLETHEHAGRVWEPDLLKTRDRISCQFSTLDLFVAEKGIDRINVLKLDVQGAEYRVLKGGANTLGKGLVDIVYMEIITLPTYKEQWRLSEYLNFLEGFGMMLYSIYNLSHVSGQLRQVDAIFVSQACFPNIISPSLHALAADQWRREGGQVYRRGTR
jgi:FkbM family methyltransferase